MKHNILLERTAVLDGTLALKFKITCNRVAPGRSHEREVLRRGLIAIAALLVINSQPVAATDSEWKPVADEDGVKAWTQASGSGLPLARAMTVVDAPLCDVVAVIRDIARHCEWMADCVEARVVHRHNWARLDMYLRIKGYPWVGVADRDAVLATDTVIERPGESAEISFSITAAAPEKLGKDTVHMPKLTGSYRMRRTTDGKTEVDYRFAADLGGWVPAWVGTRTVEQLPARTLSGLRKHVAQVGSAYRAEINSWPAINGTPPCGAP